MNTKTYCAGTMAEALAEVKQDLGRDAVILHTRSFRKGRLLGMFGGQPMWEVTAAANLNVPQRAGRGRYVPTAVAETSEPPAVPPPAPPGRAGEPAVAAASAASAVTAERAEAEPAKDGQDNLDDQVVQIRKMVQTLLLRQPAEPAAKTSPCLEAIRRHLLAQDVAEEVADELAGGLGMSLTGQELSDADLLSGKFAQQLAGRLRCAQTKIPATDGLRAWAIALIGPTGVGKTTTIAKLAADFKLRQGKQVGLITIDTYRIAAVDQLRTYAEILDVPLKVVLTAGELHQAVDSLREFDVLLIDTAGRSQNDHIRLNELRRFLTAAEADEVHLVVSATGNRSCTHRTLTKFVPLGANRVIISKLDEAGTFGTILNTVAAGGIPLSYVTTGQDVPDDIEPADPPRLARMIVEGRLHAD